MSKKTKYVIHPAANEFPMLSAERFRELVEDIKANGQTDRIIVRKLANGNTEIIDGRNRQAACEEAGEECLERDISELGEFDEEGIVKFIVSKNLYRRDLNDDQRSALLVKFRIKDIKAEAAEAQKAGPKKKGKGKKDAEVPKGTVPQRIAAEAGVSEHKGKQLQAVAEHTPELLDEVASGKTPLKAAAKKAKEVKAAKPPKAPKKPKAPKEPPTLLEQVGKALGRVIGKFPVSAHAEVKRYIVTLCSKKNAEIDVINAMQKEMKKHSDAMDAAAKKSEVENRVAENIAEAEKKHADGKKNKPAKKTDDGAPLRAPKKAASKAVKGSEPQKEGDAPLFG